MRNFYRYSILMVTALLCALSAKALPNDYHVDPLPDSTVDSITQIKVSAGWLEKKADPANLLINGTLYRASVAISEMFNELTFTLETPVTKNGTYSVIIPEGTFLIGWEGDPNVVLEFSLTVKNDKEETGGEVSGGDDVMGNVPSNYVFSPEPGAHTGVLSKFSVTQTDGYFLLSKLHPGIRINGEERDMVFEISGEAENTLTWTLAKPITEPGKYVITVPEGAFYDLTEKDNPTFFSTVYVDGGEAPEPEYFEGEVNGYPAQDSTVVLLQKVAIQFPKLTSAFLGPEKDGIRAYFMPDTNGDDSAADSVDVKVPFTVYPDEDDFNEAHVMWVEFENPLTNEGVYTIDVPAQAFVVSKYPVYRYNAPFALSFRVKKAVSIGEIEADEAAESSVEYFTPSGQRVSEPGRGVYIMRQGSKVTKVIF